MTTSKAHRCLCEFCDHDQLATHIAAQSGDAGKTFDWHLICDDHAAGWNDGGDWEAPAFRIGEKVAL